ncbi:hypothetical protein CEXT_166931 [Caerostris extrusa]|uniref:Uncharacterized protein n=1 Tax=Caerostris extrusa TaxID=172846 RepID=A0AAV4PBT4_CAEEX|nr:hypothetical protein CEXT_166931 [Caerostris extrusa]
MVMRDQPSSKQAIEQQYIEVVMERFDIDIQPMLNTDVLCTISGIVVVHPSDREVRPQSDADHCLHCGQCACRTAAPQHIKNHHFVNSVCRQRDLTRRFPIDIHSYFRDISDHHPLGSHGIRQLLLQNRRTHRTLCCAGAGGRESRGSYVPDWWSASFGGNSRHLLTIRNEGEDHEGRAVKIALDKALYKDRKILRVSSRALSFSIYCGDGITANVILQYNVTFRKTCNAADYFQCMKWSTRHPDLNPKYNIWNIPEERVSVLNPSPQMSHLDNLTKDNDTRFHVLHHRLA